MTKIRAIDMKFLDDVLGMNSGYVLNFSDKTFAQFFADELNIDIDDPRYKAEGTSKAKRLRYFLKVSDDDTAGRTLRALWEYRGLCADRSWERPTIDTEGRYFGMIAKIKGEGVAPAASTPPPVPVYDFTAFAALQDELLQLSVYAPHARGYAFESWLKRLFNAFHLEARSPFRTVGEQIDGSFMLAGETYLLEAKWQNQMVGAADLHIFQGKIDQKAQWARGLFVSNSGFSAEGLEAFGRGKRCICMDGLDLYDMLSRKLPLPEVLTRKVRYASETGKPFASVRDLFN